MGEAWPVLDLGEKGICGGGMRMKREVQQGGLTSLSSFCPALRKPLLPPSLSRLSNPLQLSTPETSAKIMQAGLSGLSPSSPTKIFLLLLHPLQDIANQELHCCMTNPQTQANFF